MELRKEDIQVLRTKSRATSQVTFDVDYNVPDVKPDIGRMVQNKGDVSVEEVRLSDGHAFLKGSLQYPVHRCASECICDSRCAAGSFRNRYPMILNRRNNVSFSDANSSFSSNGTSGRIIPSIPTSAALLQKRSIP